MSNNWEDMDIGEETWLKQLLEARRQARDALSECAVPEINNWQAVNANRLIQFLHSQTMDYYRHVAPKAEGIPDEMWTEVLTQVDVPKAGTVDAGMTDWYGEPELENVLEHAKWESKPVSLDSLVSEWQGDSNVRISAKIRNRATGQTQHRHQQFDVHLPPIAAELVIGQLDKCINNLGWLPDASEIDIKEDDIEVRR